MTRTVADRSAITAASQRGIETPGVESLRRETRATYVALAFTIAATLLAFRQLGGSLAAELARHQWSLGIGQLTFMLIMALLIWGNFVYQLTRLGHLRRCARHRPAARTELERIYARDTPPLAILVPSYKEELVVVRCALLSAALQEYPNRRIALLIDDPVQAQSPAGRAAQTALRELPCQLQARFDASARPFVEAEQAFSRRCRTGAQLNARRELRELAQLYQQASQHVDQWRASIAGVTAGERLLLSRVLAPLAKSHLLRSAHLEVMGESSLPRLACEYRRLASLFSVSFSAFERKRYENLSHEPNKAMNLNSYLSLLGGRFNEIECGGKRWLVAAGAGSASVNVAATDFVITLDADSILLPEYALRLMHQICLPGNERVAVVQTPYTSIPAAPGSLEYVAGATTDVQYLIHQGFTAFDATFWVGANALLRVAALHDIKTRGTERGHRIVRFIQDRTVIEDTESSIDLVARGWTLQNYPERLSYSATPPDFGALLIQRRRWANGGLIILPKCMRHLLRAPRWSRIVEAYFRCHYLGSIAVVNIGLLLILAFPFDDRVESLWLPLTALPYFLLYGRDLVRIGYRLPDLASVYALNLLLIPINLSGVYKSIEQALTGRKSPFGRTPKVQNRTAAPARYLLAEYAMLILWSLVLVFDLVTRRWTHGAFAAFNIAFLGVAIFAFIGWSSTVTDLRAAWRKRARSAVPKHPPPRLRAPIAWRDDRFSAVSDPPLTEIVRPRAEPQPAGTARQARERRRPLDYRALLGVILILALLLRVLPLTYSHFWDETVFLQDAKVISDGRTNYDEFFERPPLLSMAYALGFSLWDNVYVANVVQGLISTLAVLFAFLYARRTFGLLTGLCAAFLMGFAPYFVEASHDLLTDMPAVALMLAAMWLFDLSGKGSALLAGVTYALAIETRFTSLFLIVYFLLEVATSPRRLARLVLLGVGAAGALAPYLLWLKWHYGSFFYPFVLARRIVQEWTAPVPPSFYFEAVRGIFPLSLWAALALAVVSLLTLAAVRMRDEVVPVSGERDAARAQIARQLTLLVWGSAFFAYMLSIPHKEVRYLLPLAIPAVVLAAVGIATLWQWVAPRAMPLRAAAILLGALIAVVDYGPPLRTLTDPWVDRSVSAEVQIAQYLRTHSAPSDTVYAAHNFPVLAFYSERRTVSLLPIQDDFKREWRELMSQPGFFVYFLPERIGEIHARHALKPDGEFLAAHGNFVPVQRFPTATVYQYVPSR